MFYFSKCVTLSSEMFEEMMATFRPYDLELVVPGFDSTLAGLIIELDHLRRIRLSGTTPPSLFYQLKSIFHTMESVGSSRIEGNRTTIAEYIESRIDTEEGASTLNEGIQEIQNIEIALDYIEVKIREGYPINESFVRELHSLVVSGLSPDREGDNTPGTYRTRSVAIKGSNHLPPESALVPVYMQELFDFLSAEHLPQFDLLKVAIAHHRFVWIHPFANGNGRTVRLFTYALLLRYGFGLDQAQRIINPTAVFCVDRNRYYDMLTLADKGDKDSILSWCEYVLSGLKEEVEKIDRLSDYSFLKSNILIPTLSHAQERMLITKEEHGILSLALERLVIQNSDLQELFPEVKASTISYKIKGLLDRGMLVPVERAKRKYEICFLNNHLLRAIMYSLDKAGFLAVDE